MAKVLNFHHAGLCVPKEKFEQAKAFYQELFEYEPCWQAYERDCNYVDMRHESGTWFEVVDVPETMSTLQASEDALFEHVAYEVDDIHGFLEMAVAHGASIVFGPIEAQFCGKQDILVAYIKGVSGEAIEITQNV